MFKYIVFLTIILEGEFLVGHYLNNQTTIEERIAVNNIEKKWIGPLSVLFNNMVFVLDHLVSLYFFTFNNCYCQSLYILNSLIYGYYDVLKILIVTFLHFPTNIISIFGLYIALYFCNKIVKTIFQK